MTNFWTVYVNDEIFDIMTDFEVAELLGAWEVSRVDDKLRVIEFA